MSKIEGLLLNIRCREVHDIAQRTKETLLPMLHAVRDAQKVHLFKERVKPPKSIWLKVHRNRRSGLHLRQTEATLLGSSAAADAARKASTLRQISEYEAFDAEQVLDAWGCRYVTLFEDQRLPLIRELFESLEAFNNNKAPIAVKLKRCSIYYLEAGSEGRMRASEIRDALRDTTLYSSVISDRSAIEEPTQRDGYSSIHFSFEMPVVVEFPRGDEPQDEELTLSQETGKFEVQVRDIVEEAWSEAEHWLFYADKDSISPRTELQKEELARLKKRVDNNKLAIEAIRRSLATYKRDIERIRDKPPNREVSATSRQEDVAHITRALSGQAPPELLAELAKAYESLKEAEAAKTETERQDLYSTAASKFENVRAKLDRKLKNLRIHGDMPIGYFIDIELANSYAFSAQDDRRSSAINLYKEIFDRYPGDPTVRYRYARALTRSEPSNRLAEALNLIRNIPEQVKRDPLTGPHHWLPLASAILESYIYYMQVKDSLPIGCIKESSPNDVNFLLWNNEVSPAFEKAATAAEAGIIIWKGLSAQERESEPYRMLGHKAMSNSVYYLSHLLKKGKREDIRQKLSEVVEVLKAHDVLEDYGSYKDKDNIMHGFVALGHTKEAVNAARFICETFKQQASQVAGKPVELVDTAPYIEGDELDVFKRAMNVLFSQGERWD